MIKYTFLFLLSLRIQIALAQFDYLQHLNIHGPHKPIIIANQLPDTSGTFHTINTHYWVYSATGVPVRHVIVDKGDTSRITFYQYIQQQLVVQLFTNTRRDTFAYTQFLYRSGFVETAILYKQAIAHDVFTLLELGKKSSIHKQNQRCDYKNTKI